MYNCYIHGWSSHFQMCPQCVTYTTSADTSTVSVNNCAECLRIKSAADKLAEALEWIVDLQDPKKNDLSYEDTKYTEAEIAKKALKEYRGEDLSNKEETSD